MPDLRRPSTLLVLLLLLVAPMGSAIAQAWQADWIWAPTSTANQWVAFRKTFVIDNPPTVVHARIAAASKYWLYVNGTLAVFEGSLKGGPSRGDTYYDDVDIGGLLRPGTNTIALLAWYLGKDSYSDLSRGPSGGGVLFQADVNGTVLVSDASWKARPHPGYLNDRTGTQPNARLAEWNISYDARQGAPIDGWTNDGYDDSSWPPAWDRGAAGGPPWNKLVVRPTPLLRFSRIRGYSGGTSSTSGGRQIVIGQLPTTMHVTPYIQVDAQAGAVIDMQTDLYQDGGQPNVRASYVTRTGVQEFEALAWMAGNKVTYSMPASVRVVAVGYRESGYDTDITGSFASSDPFLDELWKKAARTVYVSMRDSYMDCPTRERAQWAADAVNELRAGAFAFDDRAQALTAKALHEMVTWRRTTGELFSPVPSAYWLWELPQQTLATVWGAYQYYLFSGDSSWMSASYRPLVDHVMRWRSTPEGLVEHRIGEWDWADWGDNIDNRLLENAWYALAVRGVIGMARALGDTFEVRRWQTRYDSVAAGFQTLWDPSRQAYRWRDYTGPADDRGNALAVVAGLVPPARFDAITRLLQTRMNATPYLEFYVLEALYLMQAPDAATTRMHTRYGPQVAGPYAGPTLWEFWDPNAGTRNHGWNSGPLFVLSAHAAGIHPLSAGFRTFEVKPQLGGLKYARAVVPTSFGDVAVDAQNLGARAVQIALTSPAGTTARVAVPWIDAAGGYVTINGTRAYPAPSSGAVRGVTFVRQDDTALYFDVEPGSWTFLTTGASTAPVVKIAPRDRPLFKKRPPKS